jgi:hypothetical protein
MDLGASCDGRDRAIAKAPKTRDTLTKKKGSPVGADEPVLI